MVRVSISRRDKTVPAVYLSSDGHLLALDCEGGYDGALLDMSALRSNDFLRQVVVRPRALAPLGFALVAAGETAVVSTYLYPRDKAFHFAFERSQLRLLLSRFGPVATRKESGWVIEGGLLESQPCPGAILVAPAAFLDVWLGIESPRLPSGPRIRLSSLAQLERSKRPADQRVV